MGSVMGRVAIIGGRGRLPIILVKALEARGERALLTAMEQYPIDDAGAREVTHFRVERLALFLDHLHAQGVDRIVLAGIVHRPSLDPELFDPRTAQMVPRLLAAAQNGDDSTLRAVIELIEEDGFSVVGVEAVAPELLPSAGVLTGAQPASQDRHDAERAARIVAALGAVDVGQGAVVAGGLCLAVEALPGTDAMLSHVAETRPEARGGVLYKAPKPGQERRVDLPTLGPETVEWCAQAGLSGIAFEAGGVLLIDRDEAVARAERAGLFLWARDA